MTRTNREVYQVFLMHRFLLIELPCKIPWLNIVLTSKLSKLRLQHSSASSGRKKWKTKDGVYQLKDPEKPEQAVSATDDAIYADMLRDV